MPYSSTFVSTELTSLSATEAIARFEARTLSPVELCRAVIERSEKIEPVINAFTETFFEQALVQAQEAEARYARGEARSLEGVLLGVKDEAAIEGQRTTHGSLLHRDHVDTTTSPCVERLLEAGAIVHARTTTPEFACTTVTHSRLWGVTRNPWNTAYTPGGSSGGSAAALAAGTTTLATGSDIAGSIRIPAACCGVVGFKPPYGRVPQDPPYNLDPYCHEGPMARSVLDCARMQNVLAGPHPGDIASLRPKLEIPVELGDVRGWRVAYSMDLGYFEVDSDVVSNTEAALDVFRGLGCQVEEVELPWTDATRIATWTHLKHLFGTDVARNLEEGREQMTPYARDFAEQARQATADAFLDAMNVAGEMYPPLAAVLEGFDVLVCPTNALAAVPADLDPTSAEVRINGISVDPVLGWVMTYPFNMLSRCPVMSVPSGRAKTGVPTGIQIVGRSFDDVSVFRAAAAYEHAVGGFAVPTFDETTPT
jgi:Asp-tRNA(Asn)/Glu-tRNA(Gln) amidotransferase A subunit family amidase